MHATPHAWPSHTLANFPPVLVEMIQECPQPKENVAQLKRSSSLSSSSPPLISSSTTSSPPSPPHPPPPPLLPLLLLPRSVDEEWKSWGTMNNENDIIAHFSTAQVAPHHLAT